MKVCTKCGGALISDIDFKQSRCFQCRKQALKKYQLAHPEFKERKAQSRREQLLNNPWLRKWNQAKARCESKNHVSYPKYGGKEIRFFLTKDEIKILWDIDNANGMKKPSLDRIDSAGHYTYTNCRFIENSENSSRGGITSAIRRRAAIRAERRQGKRRKP